MIQLKRIEIEGFKDPSRRISITLAGDQVSVIYGKNGSGKTTLLRVINAVFSQNEQVLLDERVRQIQFTFAEDHDERFIRASALENVSPPFYSWECSQGFDPKTMRTLLFGSKRALETRRNVDRSLMLEFLRTNRRYRSLFPTAEEVMAFVDAFQRFSQTSRARFPWRKPLLDKSAEHQILDAIGIDTIRTLLINTYFSAQLSMSSQIQQALYVALSDVINGTLKMPPDADATLATQRDRLIGALGASPENPLRGQLIAILESKSAVQNASKYILYQMATELSKSDAAGPQSLDSLIAIFNDHLGNKRLVVNQTDAYIEVGAGRHQLEELSSGEQQLLSLLTTFFILGPDRDILLVDEPEISLNLEWQREIVSLASGSCPRTQLILTTHSPAIAPDPSCLTQLN